MSRWIAAAAVCSNFAACDGCREGPPPRAVSGKGAWVTLEAGAFTMGSPTTEPCREADEERHEVTLTRAFAIGAREVTRGRFAALMGYDPSFREGCEDCPVDSVTHHEALAYCAALSVKQGLPACHRCEGQGGDVRCQVAEEPLLDCRGYRLPTEAEWEYAARAGTKTSVSAGRVTSCMTEDEVAGRVAWYKVSSRGQSHPVGTKAPNGWGLYDMHGNAYEWTADWYGSPLSGGTDPTGPATGTERVLRGGSWYHNAEHLRSANRHAFRPDKRLSYVGFRCARTMDKPAGR